MYNLRLVVNDYKNMECVGLVRKFENITLERAIELINKYNDEMLIIEMELYNE